METRCTIESGSFFDRVLAGDAYVCAERHPRLADSEADQLRNIREAIRPERRPLLIELVLPEGNSGHTVHIMNQEMLLGPRRPRSADERGAVTCQSDGDWHSLLSVTQCNEQAHSSPWLAHRM